MTTKELLQKIRVIEIKTKGLTKHIFSGEYHASFKGKGMAFSEVREYQIGDEVRTIDWNVTARFNTPFVKVFEEERELTVMLVIDVSGSTDFGTTTKTKKDLILEIAAVLSFSAVANNDKVGAIFCTDRVEKYIAPAKGKKHALLILREIIEFQPESKRTNLSEGMRFFRNVLKKRSIGIVISDFLDPNAVEDGLKITGSKHDLLAIHIADPADRELPNVGMVEFFNAETNQKTWVNTSSEKVRSQFSATARQFEQQLQELFKRTKMDHVSIDTTDDFILKLIQLFNSRK
ncbi:MAG: DUF58 domain-containing protein [Crocinitomicaceae bacterium]|nr:MAG: DUF58 domain-containing protein [Crocinitomicaceae bacterium]